MNRVFLDSKQATSQVVGKLFVRREVVCSKGTTIPNTKRRVWLDRIVQQHLCKNWTTVKELVADFASLDELPDKVQRGFWKMLVHQLP